MSRCSHCGKENPAPYRFCGSCGKLIEGPRSLSAALMEAQPPAPPKQTPVPTSSKAEPARREEPTFGGPSFLGLNGDRSGAEYLLEDEESSSGHGRRMVLALVILLLAGALLGWRFYFGAFPWQARGAASANNNVTAQTNAPQDGQSAADNSLNSNSSTNPANAGGNDAQGTAAQTSGAAASNTAPTQDAAKPADPNAAQTPAAVGTTPDTTDATQQAATSNPADTDKAAGSENAQAAPEPAKKTAQLKETAPVSKSTARKVAMREEDSQESEAAALLTQGERYLYGNGVEQNCGRAQDSIRAAADHASVQALTDLGTMYSTGHCVRKDLPTAYRWYVKALHQQPSNPRISSDLQALWNQMTPQEKQIAMQTR